MPSTFWQTDLMRDALAAGHMGHVIFAFRTHPHHGRQLSQEQVAGWLGLTQAQLSRIEKGAAPEHLSKLIKWAQALRIPEELLWFKIRGRVGDSATPATSSDPANPEPDADLRLAQRLMTCGAEVPIPMGDSRFEHQALPLEDSYRHFDRPTVDVFVDTLAKCKADDRARGSAAALSSTLGLLAAIRRHCKDAKPDIRRSLLSLGAEGAEFCGWLYRDMRRPAVAGYWYDRAVDMAQEAGDLPMQGYVLLRKSQMAYEERDGVRVLALAQAARCGPWQLSAAVRAEVIQQEARGLAMLGEPLSLVEQALDDATAAFTAGETDQNTLVPDGYNEQTHLLRTASCYVEAGKPARAATLFGRVLGTGHLSGRDEGYFRARHAGALALCGEPDQAADEGLRAMVCAIETQSSRTKRELCRVVDSLSRWHARPGPRELAAALSADDVTASPSANPGPSR
ncbi:helix-turn-helix transcriptional regulator [Nocardia higoensis]|nr:helix-turn-helix transcriptional regulator [Nocardia higoensis]